jgi:hypothetical protein
MITRKKALEIMESFHSDSLRNMKEVDFAISIAAGTGNESISFFYPAKLAGKLKTTLRKNGFYLETLTFRSMPTNEFLTVVWDSSILSSHERTTETE